MVKAGSAVFRLVPIITTMSGPGPAQVRCGECNGRADACAVERSATVLRVTVVQTVLVFVLIPAAIYGVIALLTLVPKMARSPKYRSGQEWTYDPVWWSANLGGQGSHDAHAHSSEDAEDAQAGEPVRTARGGARGNW